MQRCSEITLSPGFFTVASDINWPPVLITTPRDSCQICQDQISPLTIKLSCYWWIQDACHAVSKKKMAKQESPPVWTEEAYCLPCSKCLLCWSVLAGGGVPTLAGGTYPDRGGTYPGWGYLPYPGGGIPTLVGEVYLPLPGGGGTYPWLGEGVPTLVGEGVPTLTGWYLPWLGIPTLARGRGTNPSWGGVPTLLRVPTLAGGTYPGQGGRDTYPGWGRRYLSWLGEGVPTLARGEGYLSWKGGGVNYPGWEEGVPTLVGVPPGVDRQTPVKTVPSRYFACGW